VLCFADNAILPHATTRATLFLFFFLFCCFALKINALQQAVFRLGLQRVARSLRFCSTIHRSNRPGRRRENTALGLHPAAQ
jgi:hypothetical protein